MNLKQKMSGLDPLKKGILMTSKEIQLTLPLDLELDLPATKALAKEMLPL